MLKTILIENWKTSLLGLILLGSGLYTGLSGKQNWTECSPVLLAGIGLLYSGDARKYPGKNLSILNPQNSDHD